MAELECYCDLTQVSDLDMIEIIREIIDEVMIENRVYYDDDNRQRTIEVIHPVIAGIVLNPRFSHIRGDAKAIIDLTTYLVINLS